MSTSDRTRSTSLVSHTATPGNEGMRRSKSASTLKEEKQKEDKEANKGFLSARGEDKGNEATRPSERKRPPSPRFDKEAFYEAEAKLSVHERRMRYKTVDPIVLDDILTWSDYAKTIKLMDPKEVDNDYQEAMNTEREWYDPIERQKEKQRRKNLFGGRGMMRFAFGATSDSDDSNKSTSSSSSSSSSSSYEEEDPSPQYAVDEEINSKISIWQGDITRLEIDGIVNAANESLLGGGGIDGAIHAAAGPTLVRECKLLGGADTGETKLTLGHRLPAKYILHTVGPRVGGRAHKLPKRDLENCYISSLDLVKKHKMRSVAFCSISTGIFGYPLAPATHSAVRTARKWLENKKNLHRVDRIIFCVFSDQDRRMYESVMQVYFPLPPISRHVPLPNLKTLSSKQEEKYSVESVEEIIKSLSGRKDLNLEGLKSFIKNSETGSHFLEFTFPGIALEFPKYLDEEAKKSKDYFDEVTKCRNRKQEENDRIRKAAQEKRDAEIKKIKAKYDNKPLNVRRPSPETEVPPALVLPRQFQPGFGEVPLLVPLCDNTLILRRKKVASLLALAFLCMLPEDHNSHSSSTSTSDKTAGKASDDDHQGKGKDKKDSGKGKGKDTKGKGKAKGKNGGSSKEASEAQNSSFGTSSLHSINFAPLFAKEEDEEYNGTQAAKLQSIINYFNVILKHSPEGHIYLRRKFFSGLKLPTSEGFTGGKKNSQFISFSKDSSPLSTIADPGVKQLYAFPRGHVPLHGLLQNRALTALEERAFISPELLVIPLLVSGILMPNESVEVMGALNYNYLLPNSLPDSDDDIPSSGAYPGFTCRGPMNAGTMGTPKKVKSLGDSMNPKDRLSEFASLAHRPRSGTSLVLVDLAPLDPELHYHRYNYGNFVNKMFCALAPFHLISVDSSGDSFIPQGTNASIAIGSLAAPPISCPIDLQLLMLMLVLSRVSADNNVNRLQVTLHGVVQKYPQFNSLYNILRTEKVEIPDFWRHLVAGIGLPKFKEYMDAKKPQQEQMFEWCEWRFKGWKKELARIEAERQAKMEKQRQEMEKKKKEMKKKKKEMEKKKKEQEKKQSEGKGEEGKESKGGEGKESKGEGK